MVSLKMASVAFESTFPPIRPSETALRHQRLVLAARPHRSVLIAFVFHYLISIATAEIYAAKLIEVGMVLNVTRPKTRNELEDTTYSESYLYRRSTVQGTVMLLCLVTPVHHSIRPGGAYSPLAIAQQLLQLRMIDPTGTSTITLL